MTWFSVLLHWEGIPGELDGTDSMYSRFLVLDSANGAGLAYGYSLAEWTVWRRLGVVFVGAVGSKILNKI